MSSDDGTDDPYRTPGPQQPGQPYPGRPSPMQPFPGQLPGQQHPGGPGGGPAAHLPRPPAVVRLRQVMLAGAVASVLMGVYSLLTLGDVVEQSRPELEQVARDAGWDPSALADTTGTVAGVVLVLLSVLSVGLWLLFARLFDQGRGRVAGTVLGGLNGASGLVGLLAPGDVLEWALTAVTTALVVAGLVLLWRPASSAWFRAAEAARAHPGWA